MLGIVRGVFWKGFYELLGRTTHDVAYTAMNFGYDDGRVLVDPSDPERWPLQLYARAVDGVEVEGKEVVDVSCGRGGGLAWIERHRRPGSARGIDFTPANIGLCRARWSAQPIAFAVSSATKLALADRSADVLVSVEASHCYGDVGAFLREAARVLRDDGVLCWTDFEKASAGDERRALCREHFAAVEDVDIGAHVLAAMANDRERRRGLIRRHTARPFWRPLDHFAASADDVDTVRRFREGRARYFMRRLRGPRRTSRA